MGREIERKFLMRHDRWRADFVRSVGIRQAYLASTDQLSLRVRIRDDGTAALTLKGRRDWRERAEYEYAIPLADAEELIGMAQSNVLEKRRHIIPAGGLTWEIDEFGGRHQGLVVAEVELEDSEQTFEMPNWIGEEVTDDPRYANETLAKADGPPR